MSNLIKLKQIKDGILLQNDVTSLKTAVNEIDAKIETSVNEAITNAEHATAAELTSHINNEGTAKHVSTEDITKWNTAANLVEQLTGDETGGLGSITETINTAIQEHSLEADGKYATIESYETLDDTINGTNGLAKKVADNTNAINVVDDRVGTLPEGTPSVVDYIDDKVANHAIKGQITNSDIAANAAIDQSKIANLSTTLSSKADASTVTTLIGSDTNKSARTISQEVANATFYKLVVKKIEFSDMTNIGTAGAYTGFTVPLVTDEGYNIAFDKVKVIVNSVVYVINNVDSGATTVSVDTGYGADGDDEIYVEFYERKVA